MSTVTRTVTRGDALASVSAACCRTTFSADSMLRAERMHVEYHNSQHRRGRRDFRLESPISYNVIIEHAQSNQLTLAASMITWDEAQSLQTALLTLGNSGAADILLVRVVRVRES